MWPYVTRQYLFVGTLVFFRVNPGGTRMLPVCSRVFLIVMIYSIPTNTFCQFVTDAATRPET